MNQEAVQLVDFRAEHGSTMACRAKPGFQGQAPNKSKVPWADLQFPTLLNYKDNLELHMLFSTAYHI